MSRLRAAAASLPENVRALGWVSFANDFASELIYPVLPLFLTITLGAPVALLGVIEGVAEGFAITVRGAAGYLSDRVGGGRKRWISVGYALSALARPVLAAAPSWGVVLAARLTDRFGKAARTGPRDALIRDSTAPQLMGASFGYHRAMDTAGAVIGPLIAAAALAAGLSLRSVLWIAVLPGFLTLVALRRVREAPKHTGAGQPIKRSELWRQPRAFWLILGVWVVFSIGNSSDVFLILRAHNLGLATTLTILAYALYNLVYSVLAWPLGALSDRLPRALIIGTGFAVFAIVYLGFGLTRASWSIWPLFAIYGAYVAATEGVAKAWIGDHVDAERSGTAYGVFAAATGVSMLLASVGAGVLWSRVGPGAPFYLGAASASLALVMLIIISVPWSRSPAERQRS